MPHMKDNIIGLYNFFSNKGVSEEGKERKRKIKEVKTRSPHTSRSNTPKSSTFEENLRPKLSRTPNVDKKHNMPPLSRRRSSFSFGQKVESFPKELTRRCSSPLSSPRESLALADNMDSAQEA